MTFHGLSEALKSGHVFGPNAFVQNVRVRCRSLAEMPELFVCLAVSRQRSCTTGCLSSGSYGPTSEAFGTRYI